MGAMVWNQKPPAKCRMCCESAALNAVDVAGICRECRVMSRPYADFGTTRHQPAPADWRTASRMGGGGSHEITEGDAPGASHEAPRSLPWEPLRSPYSGLPASDPAYPGKTPWTPLHGLEWGENGSVAPTSLLSNAPLAPSTALQPRASAEREPRRAAR